MAADGSSFGISVGLDLAICVIILCFFGYFRRTAWTEKFYEPKRQAQAFSLIQAADFPTKPTDSAYVLLVQSGKRQKCS